MSGLPERLWMLLTADGHPLVGETAGGELVAISTADPAAVAGLIAQGQRAAEAYGTVWVGCYELAGVPIPIAPPVAKAAEGEAEEPA